MMILFSLIAAFFSWVSAEPFWLAVGHGDTGTITITQCSTGMNHQCEGQFSSGRQRADVALIGTSDSGRHPGDALSAQMVSNEARTAYVGSTAGLHLRWVTGFGLVLLCGLAIAWATGSMRLHGKSKVGGITLEASGHRWRSSWEHSPSRGELRHIHQHS